MQAERRHQRISRTTIEEEWLSPTVCAIAMFLLPTLYDGAGQGQGKEGRAGDGQVLTFVYALQYSWRERERERGVRAVASR
jgi:hypothetical protein